MSAQHTPGEWTAGAYSSVVGLPIMAQPDKTKNSVIICVVRGERGEAEANARLIAAAPDMLKALRGAKDALRSYQYGNSATDLAEEIADACEGVIASATGAA